MTNKQFFLNLMSEIADQIDDLDAITRIDVQFNFVTTKYSASVWTLRNDHFIVREVELKDVDNGYAFETECAQ